MLVLAVLVLIAAIAWPLLDGPFAGQRLRKGADQFRAACGESRVEAMSTGLIHALTYQPESGSYRLAQWEGAEMAVEGEAGSAAAAGGGAVPLDYGYGGLSSDRALPETIFFVAGQSEVNARAEDALATHEEGQQLAPDWSQPILFYPDGTTSSARVILRNEYGRFIVVELRGLTGVATVSDFLTEEQLTKTPVIE